LRGILPDCHDHRADRNSAQRNRPETEPHHLRGYFYCVFQNLSSDHLLSGGRAEYKKAGTESTAQRWSATGINRAVPSSQFSVLSEKRRDWVLRTENWELPFAGTLISRNEN